MNFLAAVLALAYQEGKVVVAARSRPGRSRCRLEARLLLAPCARPPRLEIKSATYHNLRVVGKERPAARRRRVRRMNPRPRHFEEIAPGRWRLGKGADRSMKADAEVFASRAILQQALDDASIEQVVNVACLPGLVGPSLAMPDIHHGYGFCIGGVAAFPADGGIVLPGGVGYDINCGVRLLASSIPAAEFAAVAASASATPSCSASPPG